MILAHRPAAVDIRGGHAATHAARVRAMDDRSHGGRPDGARLTLHGLSVSGHTHRVRLLLSMLGLPCVLVDSPARLWNTPAFRSLNPLGEIPVLVDDGVVIADSNAILVYLVRRHAPHSHWLPDEPVAAASVQRWLSIAAGEMRYGLAAARSIVTFGVEGNLAEAATLSAKLLEFMERHLTDRDWLASGTPTIADLACYSFVAHAPEGGVRLDAFPAIQAWLERVEALPRFLPMQRSDV